MANIGRKRNANLDEELRAGEKRPREKAAQQSRKRGSSKQHFAPDTLRAKKTEI